MANTGFDSDALGSEYLGTVWVLWWRLLANHGFVGLVLLCLTCLMSSYAPICTYCGVLS